MAGGGGGSSRVVVWPLVHLSLEQQSWRVYTTINLGRTTHRRRRHQVQIKLANISLILQTERVSATFFFY